ncbi:hypothetical protein ACRRTK_020700 [Alexandromys fortis]
MRSFGDWIVIPFIINVLRIFHLLICTPNRFKVHQILLHRKLIRGEWRFGNPREIFF